MATECDSPCLAMPTQLRFQRSRARQEPRARYRGVKGRSAPCRHRDRRHGAHDPSRVSASPKSGRPDLGRAGWLVALACAQKHAPGTARGNDRSYRRSATQRACALATRRYRRYSSWPAVLPVRGYHRVPRQERDPGGPMADHEDSYVKPLLARWWRAGTDRRQGMPRRGSLTLGPVGPPLTARCPRGVRQRGGAGRGVRSWRGRGSCVGGRRLRGVA